MRLTDMQRARAHAHEAARAPANDLVSALRVHVEQRPQQVAVRFLADGESDVHELTYAGLDVRARRLAAALRAHAGADDRVLLMLPSGLDYIVAFFACQYAGMIAVPAYPAEAQHGAHLDRLRGMVGDCAARVAILGRDSLAALEAAGLASALANTVLLAPDAGDDDHNFCIDIGNPDALSFLQYTSGSTSAPKGVMVSHANVCANIDAIASAMDYRIDDRMFSWLPLYHDMGLIGGMLAPIICGFPLSLIAPPHFLERPSRWLAGIARERATVSGGPDFAFRLCIDRVRDAQLDGIDLSSWRVAFCGSEPIRQHTLDGFAERFAQWGFDAAAMYPCYGLAEATLIVTGVIAGSGAPETRFSGTALARTDAVSATPANDDDAKAVVGCGVAPPLHTFAIVDPATHARMPDGRVGEIWCTGPSIAQGYWQNPTASAAVFVEEPGFAGRWLRTGDLGFVEHEQLYVCGRRKDMIVVRGQNVYPQDIEVALADRVEWLRRGRISAFPVDLPDGSEAIGIAAEVPRGKTRKIAHEAIFGAIADALGDAFQYEAGLMLLLEPGDLPRTSSGKLQRSACLHEWHGGTLQPFAVWAAGSADSDVHAVEGTAFANPLEAFIARQWQHVLPIAAPTRDDDFFRVGGQSIAVVQLASRLGTALHIALPVGRLFAYRTVAAQAALLAREFGIDVDAEVVEVEVATQPQAIAAASASGLSAGQRSLWLLWRLAPASAAYNLSATLRLDGALDVARLRGALTALVARHLELRSRFAERDGEPLRALSDDASYNWREHDLSSFDAGQRDAHAFACANAAASEPFDLISGPMLRATLVRIAPTRSLLTVSIHHIVSDATSFGILCDELVDGYCGTALPPLHGWSLPAVSDPARLERERAFWIERLGKHHTRLTLPEETPASVVAHAEAGRVARTVPHVLAERLAALAAEHGASRFASLLAAFVALLYRVSGQRDVRVGMPVSLRRSPVDDGRVGYFVNTVVIRADVSRDLPFSGLVEQIGTRVIEALDHRDLPFADLVDALQPERRGDDTPLFNVMFNEQAVPMGARDADGLVIEPLEEQRGSAQFDLTLNVVTGGADLRLLLDYPAQRFDASIVERLLDQYLDVLVAVAGAHGADLSLGALPFASGAQPGDALPAHHFVPVHARFAQQARLCPDAYAVSCGGDSITYRELDRWSDHIAARLLKEGVKREAPVAVCVERSIALIAACFGVLKAGAAYVPLDPGYPAARVAAMLDDANVRCVVTDMVGVACLGDALASRTSIDASTLRTSTDTTTFEATLSDATNLAYVIYTSGSTGRPKGVAVPHGAFDRLVASIVETVGVDERDTWLAVTSPSFDISLLELCLPLTVGARIELAPRDVVRDGARLAALLDKSHATILQATPASWRLLLAGGWSHSASASDNAASRLKGLCGGEALAADLADALLARGADIWNVYGPTETTIWSTCGAVRAQTPVTLGRALHYTQLQLHDVHGDATPAGGIGELSIGGDNLARGYLGRPGLTAERFVPDPHGHGARVYRTGDLCRVRGDGRLDYLGRIDHQIKLRGHRIEPGDIEAALRRCDGVSDAVVLLREDGRPARLVGYVAATDVSSKTLLDALAATLPGFMVPSTVVVLDALPLTPSGKIDRRALPVPTVTNDAVQADATEAALTTPTEHAVADAWRDVLGIERPGASAHFFELGGHSLLALKVVSRLQQRLSRDVPLDLLFSHPTLGAFAAALDNASSSSTPEIALLPRGLHDAPLSLPQERLWVLWRLDPDSAAYNVSGALELDGAFDARAAQQALDALVRRHAMLRTRFAEVDDMPRQLILAPGQSADAWRWNAVDAQGKDRASLAAQLRVRAREPFDLEQGPLLRATLFTLAPQRYVLHFVMHHIASDGWSIDVLLREFAAGYRAARRGEMAPLAALPALPVQYADYAAWQRDRFDGAGRAVLDAQLAYWRDRLAGLQSTLDLPTEHDRNRPYDPRGARVGIRIPASLAARAEALARDEGATLFMVLLAALDVLLYRYSGATDVPVAVPVAGRDRLETEGLIGFFVNTLVMRATLSGAQPFAALLQQVRIDSIAAQAHRDVPFDRVVADLQLERRASGNPLAQVKLMVHDGFDAALDLDGVQCRLLDADESDVRFELALDIARGPHGLDCTFVYAADVYDETFITQFARHYADLLAQTVDEPQRTLGAFALRDDDEVAYDALPVSGVGMS
ncbi:amino acid adenylation domain-containing protein [Paraburkholderia sp.]|uniref:amino acid adenylation domain-containing protein n=1 Tax=Paraburkholderia sp. TaxID=1926495 RepID=UPI003D6E6ACF